MRRMHIIVWLLVGSALLTLFWLPGLRYPILSDTAVYALLGKSVWMGDGYRLLGELYFKHLPFHAVASYPFVMLAGPHVGMKLSTLAAGIGVLIATFALMRQFIGDRFALVTSMLVLIHPGFVLMTMLGSADLLYTALFIGSVAAFVKAKSDPRLYVLAGVMAGLACVTRYNALPLIVLFPVWALLRRDRRAGAVRSPWFWIGMILMGAIATSWMIRNAVLTGSPFQVYVDELDAEAPSRLAQLLSNLWYYANPVHNVFPFFFLFAVYGVMRYGVRYSLLVFAMLAGWAIAAIWWVQAIRFAFAGYVILLGFTAMGLRDLWEVLTRQSRVSRGLLVTAVATAFVSLQGLSMCVYAYGTCNAAFDRVIGIVPPNMGLTTEGFYAWANARDWFSAYVESGRAGDSPTVYVGDPLNEALWKEGVFPQGVRVTADPTVCPRYWITQRSIEGAEVLYQTDDAPVTFVLREECR